jgi:3-oxoacyl-(acyl-carrier-protein) synthase
MNADNQPVLTALGLLTPLGHGREAFLQAWRDGGAATPVPDGPTRGGVAIDGFVLRTAFPEGRALMRRMDRLSKMICMAGALARDDAPGIGPVEGLALGVGTDLGTLEETWAFLCRLRDKGPEFANPNDFPNLVPNAGAGYLGILMGARGPSHTFCQHSTCADDALAWAADGVLSGWFDGALAGGAEELGPIRAKAMARSGCPITEGPAGEGGALVLVESLARARGRGATPLCAWAGSWGGSGLRRGSPLKREVDPGAVAELVQLAVRKAGVEIGVALLSHPQDAALREGVRAALGREVPMTDHDARCGIHPADGALRAALAALLLQDPTLPVHRGGALRSGEGALLLSAGRGGGLRASVLTAL